MRLVRCDHCGAKALSAASQCPRCTQPLNLRDDRGGTVPLAHCRLCNTYYPRSMGACKWCGAPASGPSPSRALWAVAAVAALAVGVLLGWWVWRTRTPSMADVMGVPVRLARPSPSVRTRVDSSRSENGRVVALPPDDVELTAPSRVLAPAPSGALSPAPSGALSPAPSGALSPAPSGALSPTSPATLARAAVPASAVETWRAAVANAYANLRADARVDARIVGVLSPNQRLQVGEVVKGWRRVKTGAAEGWADATFLTVR